jgi:hypothetical protein
MQPQSPHDQIGAPTNLPPVAPLGATPMSQVSTVLAPQATATSGTISIEQARQQAKQLVEQYKTNPYQLSAVLQELKNQYLSSAFNIVVNPVEK